MCHVLFLWLSVAPLRVPHCFSLSYADDNPHGEKSIPRVDTFASNLHDSWGAHAQHDSPPANESTLNDPPRLSTESLRSSTSAASKASSGQSSHLCVLTHVVSPQLPRSFQPFLQGMSMS